MFGAGRATTQSTNTRSTPSCESLLQEARHFLRCSFLSSSPCSSFSYYYKLSKGCKVSNGLGIVVFLLMLTTLYATTDLQIGRAPAQVSHGERPLERVAPFKTPHTLPLSPWHTNTTPSIIRKLKQQTNSALFPLLPSFSFTAHDMSPTILKTVQAKKYEDSKYLFDPSDSSSPIQVPIFELKISEANLSASLFLLVCFILVSFTCGSALCGVLAG
jgi:hypothetical protein